MVIVSGKAVEVYADLDENVMYKSYNGTVVSEIDYPSRSSLNFGIEKLERSKCFLSRRKN